MNDLIVLARENIELIVAVGSAIVAVIGAVLSGNAARRQHKVQTEQLRQSLDRASLDWGCDAISALADAGAVADLCRTHVPEHEIEARKAVMASRISALVDRGRLFFPNIDPKGKGADKEAAYQGHRPPILDALMFAYYEVQSISRGNGPSPRDSANFIFECRRLLVSELQAHLDPRRRDEVINRYDRQRAAERNAALDIAGRLGLKLDARRPGLLTEIGERGWMDRIGPEERRRILHEFGIGNEHPAPAAKTPTGDLT